jgi:hypothetical protein
MSTLQRRAGRVFASYGAQKLCQQFHLTYIEVLLMYGHAYPEKAIPLCGVLLSHFWGAPHALIGGSLAEIAETPPPPRVMAGSAPLQWRLMRCCNAKEQHHWCGALPAMNYGRPSRRAFSRWKSSITASMTARTRGRARRSRWTSSHCSANTSGTTPPTRFSAGSGSPR